MYEKRVYITKLVKVTYPDARGETYVPYLATIPLVRSGENDPFHWNLACDDRGDKDGLTPGYHEHCLVGVYTTLENHQTLENDSQITRIDDL